MLVGQPFFCFTFFSGKKLNGNLYLDCYLMWVYFRDVNSNWKSKSVLQSSDVLCVAVEKSG